MKPPLSSIMGSSRRVADAKRDHSVEANKMVCNHDPDPEQVRDRRGWRQSTRCWRCDAKLWRTTCRRCDGSGSVDGRFPCPDCMGSAHGPWRDAI